ncbi:AI-2E family transporter [Dictyobacter alpinus]|uniref:AI-2E family transporter n=1 Tax=Dictyobacter alpinus TaxID=2014873 RepID=A0A402BKA6_9CHLR|nr:AI-2E family transporter [Dictyobacter alpinus]GCE31779.1 AI-2E family transporter [Dictyobacter alpinus]
MSLDTQQPAVTAPQRTKRELWLDRLLISLTILAWIALTGVFFWLVSQISQAVILLAIAALIAYAIYPLVEVLRRYIPKPIAITLVYLVVFGALVTLLYFVGLTLVHQLTSLIHYIQQQVNQDGNDQLKPVVDALGQFGITRDQINSGARGLATQLQGLLTNIVPVISNLFSVLLNTVLITLLSVYFLLSGPRATKWLRTQLPRRYSQTVNTVLDITGNVVGGYIRGTFLLATVISTLTGIGLFFIGVPYALLLAILAFVMEFIPVIGIYITGVAIFVLAITKSVPIAIIAVAFMLVMQLLENNVFAPRILGGSVGLNPILTIFAVFAGSERFGIAGAFFAAPVVGLIQALLQAYWKYWRTRHPEEFTEEDSDKTNKISLPEKASTIQKG